MNKNAERGGVQALRICSLKREECGHIEFEISVNRSSHYQIGDIPDGIIIKVPKKNGLFGSNKSGIHATCEQHRIPKQFRSLASLNIADKLPALRILQFA